MLLSKEIAVYLNLAACKLKQYTAAALRRSNIGLTPEQFLLIDLLWNHGPMSQQSMADKMQKDKNSVTKLVDALEAKGLVVRQKDRMLEGISEDELKAFLSTLSKLNANMEKDG